MRLDLRMLKDIPDKREDFSYSLSGLTFCDIEQPPFRAFGHVRNAAGVLRFEGRIEGVMSLICDRCGAQFEREKALDVSGILSETSSDDCDSGVFPYDGAGVELDDIFIPEFILDMDMKILCSEDCDGGDLEKYLYMKDE